MIAPSPQEHASARQALQQATRSAHDRLDASLRLVAPDLTRSEYIQTLLDFHGIYSALETELEKHALAIRRVGLDWQERRKVPLLLRDLEALGCDHLVNCPPEVVVAKLPRLDKLSRVMGCLYVLEGATLGGKVIGVSLHGVLGIGPENGGAFFNSYGSAVGSQWKRFCVALEESVTDLAEREEAAVAAVKTFDLFNICVANKER